MLFTLPRELHDWIEIQAGSAGARFWGCGLYSPSGTKRLRYDNVCE